MLDDLLSDAWDGCSGIHLQNFIKQSVYISVSFILSRDANYCISVVCIHFPLNPLKAV